MCLHCHKVHEFHLLPSLAHKISNMESKAVTFAKYNAPLEVTTINLPEELKPNKILIKVYSSSFNPLDYKRHEGKTKILIKDTFPAGICYDVAGEIVKVGSEVKNFTVGQRVCARSKAPGTLAEFCIVDDFVTAALPDNLSFVDGAALPLAGQTALQSLRAGNLKAGDSIFISGGAGGVGTYAIQLAKHVFGASRVVVTCSGAKIEFCKSLGADECIDYTKVNPYTQKLGKFDMMFDTVGEAKKMGGEMIKPGGFVISVGAMPDPDSFKESTGKDVGFFLKLIFRFMSSSERSAAHPGKYRYVWLNPNSKDLEELVGYLSEKKIVSCVDQVFEGLESAKEAFDRIKTGRAKGKVIVNVRS